MTSVDLIFLALILAIPGFFIYRYLRSRPKKIQTPFIFLSPGDGHNIYELNLSTLDLNEIDSVLKTEGVCTVIQNDNCLYCTALNEKNAIKQFNKMVPGKFEKANG